MPSEKVYKTLDDILNRNDRFDVNKVTYYTATDDESLVIPDTDLFAIYRRYINPYIGIYKTTFAQREHYARKPFLLAHDVYGTPFLGWLILMLNDQESPSKFRIKSTIKLIPNQLLTTVYDTVVTKAKGRLDLNWAKYLNMVDDNL